MNRLTFINNAVFETGAISHINELLEQYGISNPLICTDQGIVSVGILDKLRAVLSNKYPSTVFDQTPPNPTQMATEKAAEMYKQNNCDGIISLGGGSSIDLAKGVAVLVTHEGGIADYTMNVGGMEKIQPVVPHIAIPTTSGTGSEVSGGSVIIMNDGMKMLIVSPYITPSTAICDPELVKGLPAKLTAGAGMDAVAHCIEAILAPGDNPPADAVAYEGLYRSVKTGVLKEAVKNGSNLDARKEMMIVATQGAMAFTKGLGVVHTMSHACGSLPLGLHHGTLNGVILPSVLRFNEELCSAQFERIAHAMGLSSGGEIASYIEDLNREIGVPANLSEMGINKDMVAGLVAHAMQDPLNFTAPKMPSEDEYTQLFHQAAAF